MALHGLVAFLKAGLGSAIASGPFPVVLPENAALPGMTYQIAGGTSEPTFDTSGPQRLRVQFDFYGATYLSADTARDALRALLEPFVGVLPDGMFLQYAEWIQPIDLPYGNEARQFRCACEIYLHFNLL